MDLALSLDPRIKRIKQEEKAAREAKKKGKTGAQNGVDNKQKEEEEKKKAEEEAKKKEEEEKVSNNTLPSRKLSLITFVRLPVRRRRKPRPPLPTLRRRLGGKLVLKVEMQHNELTARDPSSQDLWIPVTPLAIYFAFSLPPC